MTATYLCRLLALVVLTAPVLLGCPLLNLQPPDDFLPPSDDGGSDGGSSDNGGSDSGTSDLYDPATGLTLQSDSLTLEVPPGATTGSVTISVDAVTEDDLPTPLPGNVGFTGGLFEPSGQTFVVPPAVHLQLRTPSIVPQLPVLTFDEESNRWRGTGRFAEVAENGTNVTFPIDHFSIFGVPDPVPIPDPGDPIGSFLVVSNNGNLATDAISSDSASLLYSEFGDTFNIAAFHQEVNDQGQIETQAIGLDAILITFIDNYLVAVIGGETSIYNEGQFNEPVLGVVVLSLQGTTVSASIYVATPERVIQGTLTGTI